MDSAKVKYWGHVQDVGDIQPVYGGFLCGTKGLGKRLEAISIVIESALDLGVEYEVHVQNKGWGETKRDGEEAGTRNEGLQLEAIQIRLTGADADKFDIFYGVHAQNKGNMNFTRNGASSGTEGQSLRIEGVRIFLVEKGILLTVDTTETFSKYVAPVTNVPIENTHNTKNKHVYVATAHGVSTDGNWDSGCVDGPYQEAELSLAIAKVACRYLRDWGVTVTSDSDSDNDKNMTYSVAEANNVGADYYIALHCDYNAAPSGTFPIIYPGSSEGLAFASIINDTVMQLTGLGTRGILQRADYEVTGTNMIACIFELGSIRADIGLLLNAEAYGLALAQGIFDAI